MAQKAHIVLVSLILIILISTLAVAQSELVIKEEREEYGSTPEEKSGLTPIKTHSDNDGVVYYTPPYVPAPQHIINRTNEYIISIMGKDYFDEHFKLVDARKSGSTYMYENQTIEPTYRLTYNYTHDLKDEPYRVEYTFKQGVYSNGKFMNKAYTGPKEPYNFSLSKDEVRQIAIQDGMEEPFGVELYGYKWIAMRPEEICTEKGKIERLDIHVDTGKILYKKVSEGCVTAEVALARTAAEGRATEKNRPTNQAEEESVHPEGISGKEKMGFIQRIKGWIKKLFIK